MKKTGRALIALALAVMMIPAGMTALAEGGAPRMTRDPNAGVYTTPVPTPSPTPSPSVRLPGWSETTIAADETDVVVYFPNPAANEGLYDLAFELWVALPEEAVPVDEEGAFLMETLIAQETDGETGEEIERLYTKVYASGLVPAGLCLQNITLLMPLPAGVYPAFVHMQPYRVSDFEPTSNNGNMVIKLNVVGTEETKADETEETEAEETEAEETEAEETEAEQENKE